MVVEGKVSMLELLPAYSRPRGEESPVAGRRERRQDRERSTGTTRAIIDELVGSPRNGRQGVERTLPSPGRTGNPSGGHRSRDRGPPRGVRWQGCKDRQGPRHALRAHLRESTSRRAGEEPSRAAGGDPASNHGVVLDSIFIPLMCHRRVTSSQGGVLRRRHDAWFFERGQIPIGREVGARARGHCLATEVLRSAGRVPRSIPRATRTRGRDCCTGVTPASRVRCSDATSRALPVGLIGHRRRARPSTSPVAEAGSAGSS